MVFLTTFFAILLFVAMTGFQVSAVRAAIMAFIVALAKESGRIYNPRNALILAAFVITAINPKIPVFDLGFELSFIATAAIVYLAPAFERVSFLRKGGFFSWRDALRITLAAQIAVAPLAIAHFSNFSFTALPANVALLGIMPLLMVFGFSVIAVSTISTSFATLLSKPVAFLLDYAASIVEIFSTVQIPFNPEIGIVSVFVYYAALIFVSLRWSEPAKNIF